MRHRSPSRQLMLFPFESPNWESLPPERQADLQEVLSLLLEQMLHQAPPCCDQTKPTEEKNHV